MLHDPSVELDAVGKHLLRAHEAMEKRGWCTGDYEKPDGRVCIVGSLRVTNDGMDTYFPAMNRLIKVVGTVAITEWNDICCESKQQALDALTSAAFACKMEHVS